LQSLRRYLRDAGFWHSQAVELGTTNLIYLSHLVRSPDRPARRRGPTATRLSISRRPHRIATTRRMGPRLRDAFAGTTAGDSLLHIFLRGDDIECVVTIRPAPGGRNMPAAGRPTAYATRACSR